MPMESLKATLKTARTARQKKYTRTTAHHSLCSTARTGLSLMGIHSCNGGATVIYMNLQWTKRAAFDHSLSWPVAHEKQPVLVHS